MLNPGQKSPFPRDSDFIHLWSKYANPVITMVTKLYTTALVLVADVSLVLTGFEHQQMFIVAITWHVLDLVCTSNGFSGILEPNADIQGSAWHTCFGTIGIGCSAIQCPLSNFSKGLLSVLITYL